MPAPSAALTRSVALLERLIAFPTVSSESNLALIEHVAEVLHGLGATVSLSPAPDAAKANLFATLGPDVDGGVVLSGHTDVVPVIGQRWHSDPFQALARDARIHGRGACDMKGFIACALSAATDLSRRDLHRPVHFAFTYDEEVGCLGAPVLLEALARSGRQPAVAIVGEPTGMRIIEGHKGCHEYTTRVRGLEGHASLPTGGVNAIEYASRVIAELLDIGAELARRAPPASRFDPPCSTISVGTISGGIARNVIPLDCSFEWEMRPVQPGDLEYLWQRLERLNETQLLPAMRARCATASIATETIGAVDGLQPMRPSEAIELLRELTGSHSTDVVSFGTEAGLFQQAGMATVVCGPGHIEQAHRPDEYIGLDQLDACLGMLERLGARLSAPAPDPGTAQESTAAEWPA